MQLKPLIPALMMALVAFSSLPAQATGPDCDPQVQDPAHPVTVLPEDGVACALVNGPGVLTLKGVVTAGLGLCFLPDGFPLNCDSTEAIPGFGAAFFDVLNWNDEAPHLGGGDASHDVHVWVEYEGEACGVAGFFCGFDIELCQDTDDDGNCGGDDSTHTAYAHDGTNVHPLGPPGEPDCQKDTKGAACSGFTAELTGCIDQDVTDGNDDGSWDDIAVFISTWIGASDSTLEVGEQGDFISAGIALGLFNVTVEDLGGSDETCFPDVKIVVDEPLNCEGDWENINATVPGGIGGAQCFTVGDLGPVGCGAPVVVVAGGIKTVTMDCLHPNACEDKEITVVATAFGAGATAETELWCDEDKSGTKDLGESIAKANAVDPLVPVDFAQANKTVGHYHCVITVSGPAAGQWVAGGICQDP